MKSKMKIFFSLFLAVIIITFFSCKNPPFPDDTEIIPVSPANLTVITGSSTQIDLTWTDNSDNEDGFKIEQSTDGSTFTQIDTVSTDILSYSGTGLDASTLYYYQVRAYNTAGNSGYSNIESSTTDTASVTIPVAPGTLAATTFSSTQIDLTWADNSDDEDGFKIERSLDGSTFTEIDAVTAGVATYSDTGLSAGTLYYYQVRANNTAGDSDYSNIESATTDAAASLDTDPPSSTAKLIFIHHSTGNNWLDTGNGNLGDTLGVNNYYVRDIYYGWDATENTNIGDLTDIGHWYTWFADETVQGNSEKRRDNIMNSVYSTDNKNASYTSVTDPGGENEIIMFKSCFPNSWVQDDNTTQPEDLYGQSYNSSAHTISNIKEVYRQILTYFKSRTDKMFVVIIAPPLVENVTTATEAANARTLNNWLVESWLFEGSWEDNNVYVFDFFNVLTDEDNHHRISDQQIEHIIDAGSDNYSAYGVSSSDSHPNSTGNQKSTDEFVPLLNYYYNRWKGN